MVILPDWLIEEEVKREREERNRDRRERPFLEAPRPDDYPLSPPKEEEEESGGTVIIIPL